jgi:molybdenum cofactor cytidylyltransferase
MRACGLILLAAGSSSRLHQPKQLLEYNGSKLLQRSIDIALSSEADPVLLVIGSNAKLIEEQIEAGKIIVVENELWQEGIASSIRCGLNALLKTLPNIEQTIFMVCDQPYVSTEILNKVINAAEQTGQDIIACKYADTLGTPTLFSQKYFQELLQLQGHEGAKKLIMKYSQEVGMIHFAKGATDIDTWDDYMRLVNGNEE